VTCVVRSMTDVLVTSTMVIVAYVLSSGIVISVTVNSFVEITETTAGAAMCIHAGRSPIQGWHYGSLSVLAVGP